MTARLPRTVPDVTERQLEVARLVARRSTNGEIAQALGISLDGAKYHVSELLGRLGLQRREEIADWYRSGRGQRGRRSLRRLLAPLAWASGALGLAGVAIVAFVALSGGETRVTVDRGMPPAPTPGDAERVGNPPPIDIPAAATFVLLTGTDARLGHSATLLPEGRVLIIGGRRGITKTLGNVVEELDGRIEAFDPLTESFRVVGTLDTPRELHSATLLEDGRVLIAGGGTPDGSTPFDSAEIFDPATGRSEPTGAMNVARYNRVSVRLDDGRVLIAGGFGDGPLASIEIFDPALGAWLRGADMHRARPAPTLVLLADGRVLIAGNGPLELFNPRTGSMRLLGLEPPGGISTATLLPDGRVLLVGGTDLGSLGPGHASGPGDPPATSSAVIFNPETEQLVDAGETNEQRESHAAVLLRDGRVLITGGAQDVHIDLPVLTAAEIYDPATGRFEPTGEMHEDRFGHVLTVLLDGRVLVTGTIRSISAAPAELYYP